MKTFFLILLIAILPMQENKLNGTYRIEFDKKYGKNGYQIVFNDSIFRATMPDAVMYKGKIIYDKFKTTFRTSKYENPIEIDNREMAKDIIKFSTKNWADL